MRKSFALILTALLLVSLAANAMLVNRLSTLRKTSEWEIERGGKRWGAMIAERDFSGGIPAYYVTGQFYRGDLGNPPMLTNKPGRVVVGLGCVVWPFDRSFIQAYNQRMEGLFAARQQPQISKP